MSVVSTSVHHFLDNDVRVDPLIDKQRVRLTAQDGTQTEALIINCVDAVSPEDADLREVEADRLFHAMAETTPLLCSQPDQPDAILANADVSIDTNRSARGQSLAGIIYRGNQWII